MADQRITGKAMEDDAKAMGLEPPPNPVVPQESVFKVWPENAEVVSMFLVLQRAWGQGPRGWFLDYYGVTAARIFKMHKIKLTLDFIADLTIMENAFLSAFYEGGA